MQDLSQQSILVTGGTGSFGKKFIETLLSAHTPKKIIVFSRDELKQHDMRCDGFDHPCMRYFIGDVRDKERLERAMRDVDIVVHAAALKHVPACEYNPIEAIQTNIMGAQNIINAALDSGVKKIVALSTDKAVNPVNLYGATKLCAEKLFIQSNAYSGIGGPIFSCVRYGNVVGSRGSVIPLFVKQRESGKITITDDRMTRFWITLDHGVKLVLDAIKDMEGGEIFIPKIPSMKVMDLADAIAPNCSKEVIGIRPGEKLHESLISEDEARHTVEKEDKFVIFPENKLSTDRKIPESNLDDGFSYTSNNNNEWLSVEELKEMLPKETIDTPSG